MKRKPAVLVTGYHYMSFPGGKSAAVHRLILEAFVGSCPPDMQCCHNDGNRGNNAISNLRWDTREANQADRKRHGTSNEGSSNSMSVIDEYTALVIAERLRSGETIVTIAKNLGINRRIVTSIKSGSTWSHVTGIPKRKR